MMKKTDFNRGWTFAKIMERGSSDAAASLKTTEPRPVTLPHDAMIHEHRRADAPGAIGSAYFEGGKYLYVKKFHAPAEWKDQTVRLLFEGVYRNATVRINGQKAAYHAYGYTPFPVDLTPYLKIGEENTIEVLADNSEQPNSRWYSGSGIYRPVWLLTGRKDLHIAHQGIRVTTTSIEPAAVELEIRLEGLITSEKKGQQSEGHESKASDEFHSESVQTPDADHGKDLRISVQILDGDQMIATTDLPVSGSSSQSDPIRIHMDLPGAKLWDAEHPDLYTCRVRIMQNSGTDSASVGIKENPAVRSGADSSRYKEAAKKTDGSDDSGRTEWDLLDEDSVEFGIRQLTWSAKKGFMVNGVPTDLKGGCIHHDNGILGACAYDESETRRVRIMKEAGFNAIRSAHNPCSEALLRACDHLGMYIMDELFDMWYMAKNRYDYHLNFNDCWQEDTRAMADRDYNHPSVVLYSIGNEVSEPCEQKGVETGRKMVEFLHALDTTRPVTCGTNLMIISRAARGIGIYDDSEKNNDSQKKASKLEGNQNASLMYNIMASFIGPGMNKAGNSAKVDKLVSPFCDCLDIAGYNYASGRYLMDGKLHPDRVIFGSETFPQDIYRNWQMIKAHPYLVGDFMWAGWDYLGEVGIGAWSYTGGMPFARPYPWILAGSGVIDITGRIDASGRYASMVWNAIDRPVIGVRPANHPGVRPSRSVWRATNAIESWSWKDCENNKTIVEVYGHGSTAELFLNGQSLGRKRLKDLKALFHVRYESGTLEAVIRDASGKETGRTSLVSAQGPLHIEVTPEFSGLDSRKFCNGAEDINISRSSVSGNAQTEPGPADPGNGNPVSTLSARAGELIYLDLALADGRGIVEANADRNLHIQVEGGELLGFGSANPCTEQRYDGTDFKTYYGRAQAVVRSLDSGSIHITVSADGLDKAELTIPVQ